MFQEKVVVLTFFTFRLLFVGVQILWNLLENGSHDEVRFKLLNYIKDFKMCL